MQQQQEPQSNWRNKLCVIPIAINTAAPIHRFGLDRASPQSLYFPLNTHREHNQYNAFLKPVYNDRD